MRHGPPFLDPDPVDVEERFALGTVSGYLRRLIKRYRLLDEDTLSAAVWVLGPESERLRRFALEHLARIGSERPAADLEEDGLGPDEYPRLVLRVLRRTPSSMSHRFLSLLQGALEAREKSLAYRGQSRLEQRADRIAEMFGLPPLERAFAFFLYIVATYSRADSYFVDHLKCNEAEGRKYLEVMLGAGSGQLQAVSRGILARLEMFDWRPRCFSVNEEFLALFEGKPSDPVQGRLFTQRSGPVLPLECLLPDAARREHLLRLLNPGQADPTHVLFYGPAGSGKTSLARSLAGRLKLPTYEIKQDTENNGRMRRAAILACLNLTGAGRGSLVIVDEADNLLNTRHSWLERGETQDKGWVNWLMEQPGARMIWITNRIEAIESSVLRRFAYCLEFRPFTRRQRMELWESILERRRARSMVSRRDIAELAGRFKLSAGHIDMAVRKARAAAPGKRDGFLRAVRLGLEAHEQLLHGPNRHGNRDQVEETYSIEGLRVHGDLVFVLARLGSFSKALRGSHDRPRSPMNLLFHGPPGAGKSELARHISARLDRELMVKRASDLLSPYVGMTEKNLAEAFSEAEREEAVLVVDEADTLLFSRDRARHSWEISFTNELLTQMERFRGILICTTNRLEDIDSASLRRFTFKVGLGYLTPDGNVTFYQRLLAPLVKRAMDTATRTALLEMTHLAPGDFRTVRDRFGPRNGTRVEHFQLLEALRQEVRVKKAHRNETRIGFRS